MITSTRPTTTLRNVRRRRRLAALLATGIGLMLSLIATQPASAAGYVRISGEGSSWAGNAWLDFLSNAANRGVTVDYNPNGSSVGRDDFARQINATFADSEIPFTGDAADPQDKRTPQFKYGQLPIVAGGTAFMYNLPIGGSRYTGLKLSMSAIAGIFSGVITRWNDPAIAADNKGVALPNQQITVVVRSDGSGATAQFKLWMLRQFPADYHHLAKATGQDPNHASSYYPVGSLKGNFTSQTGSTGVTTYTQNTPYTIDYDEYSYAQQAGFPVAQVKNAAGFYTLPTADAVAVGLVQATINSNPKDPNYLSQDLSHVYNYGDPRSYPMSMYSYEIIPKQTNNVTSNAKGATLAWLTNNSVCEWQREMGQLGYSPLPMNLVLAGLDQIKEIPGIDAATLASINNTEKGVKQQGTNPCNNPTFKPGDDVRHNILIDQAKFPSGCNTECQKPWKLAGTGTSSSGPTYDIAKAPTKPGATGNGAVAKSDATTSKSAGTATAPAKAQATTCDADTGVCTTTGDTSTVASNAKAVPTVVSAADGWAGPQTLMVLAGGLALAVLLAPPVVTRLVSRSRGMTGGRR